MGEGGGFLFGDSHPAEFTRQVGEISHFGAGDAAEIAGIVAVAPAIGLSADVNAHGLSPLATNAQAPPGKQQVASRPATVRCQTSAAPLAITSDSHTRDSTQGRRRMRGE
jgi:hypothetical protein